MNWKRMVTVITAVAALGCGDDVGPVDGGVIPGDGAVMRDSGTSDAGGGCVDGDEDGYGDGCAAGPDCDDTNENINPGATEVCDGVDNNCVDGIDEDQVGPSCSLTEGVCAGAVATCEDGAFACDASSYGTDYEANESLCDGLDNDCDGTTDEGCTCTNGTTQPCGSDEGMCRQGTQTCTDAAWGSCEGEVGPMGESCDGMDNDCDGDTDEPGDLTAPACPLQFGVCAGAVRSCGGAAGWVACRGVESYGGDYESEETLCDGLDNDCDGVTDEGCECRDGDTQACGSDVGACTAGMQVCAAGSWGPCIGEVTPEAETCDGIDEDCDGEVDNGITAPACELQAGVCAGTTQVCSAGGFAACGASEYGANYEAVETSCDGRDNDCDGDVDEGCDCIDGATQACGLSTGACERGTQACAAGAWGACEGGVGPTDELCDGLDNDCDGETDDNLEAPACALSEGVCEGSVRTCLGAEGWSNCDAEYGAWYSEVEDGEAMPSLCDGLDNDCDGDADERCLSTPLLVSRASMFEPFVRNEQIVYVAQSDVFLYDLGTDVQVEITNTPEEEFHPRVAGNHVVFVRSDGPDTERLFRHDLTTGTESPLGSHRGLQAWVHRDYIVYDQFPDGGEDQVRFLDLRTGEDRLFLEGFHSPVIHFPYVVAKSTSEVVLHHLETGAEQFGPTGASAVCFDGVQVAWNTGGSTFGGATPGSGGTPVFPDHASWPMADFDVWDASGGVVVGQGFFNGVFYGNAAGTTVLSRHGTALTFRGSGPSISGSRAVWSDSRFLWPLVYGAMVSDGNAASSANLALSEVLSNPPAGSDANGDGTVSATQDEFVEIINTTLEPVALAGLELSDATAVRHVFAEDTAPLEPGAAMVVFGGGDPAGPFAGARRVTASTGSLGLNNTGDTVTLRRGDGTEVATVTFDAVSGESLVFEGGAWVPHSSAMGTSGAMSPGTDVTGRAY